jgi:hypothetical protein
MITAFTNQVSGQPGAAQRRRDRRPVIICSGGLSRYPVRWLVISIVVTAGEQGCRVEGRMTDHSEVPLASGRACRSRVMLGEGRK